MKYLFNYLLITTVLIISGCSTIDENTMVNEHTKDESPLISHASEGGAPELVLNFHTHQMVGDFTERLAHGLIRNSHNMQWDGDIAIASFVNFDDTLKEANALGNLISENLLGDMQAYNLPVLDIHTKGWLEINNTGDYVFSRDSGDIIFNENIKYVLSGIMVKVERGVKINGRIIDIKTQKIISTSSVLIPNYLLDLI
jgi:TolB-like protein